MHLREIDRLVAEKLMGWRWEVVPFFWDEGREPRRYLIPPTGNRHKQTTSGDWDAEGSMFDMPAYSLYRMTSGLRRFEPLEVVGQERP